MRSGKNLGSRTLDGYAMPVSNDNELSHKTILAPSVFGRYLLSDVIDSPSVEAKIPDRKLIYPVLEGFLREVGANSLDIESASLSIDRGIFSRDFLVLIGLIGILRDPLSHLATLDGGYTFLVSDLRDSLKLSSGGKNTSSIRESLSRLKDLRFSINIETIDGQQYRADFKLFSELEMGENSTTKYLKRDWFVRLSPSFLELLDVDIFEQTKYNLDDLLEHRKSPLTIAIKAHYQTVSYNKTYDKKLSTLLRNINKLIDTKVWRDSSAYRSKISGNLRRMLQRVKQISLVPPKSLIYLLSQPVTYSQPPF